MSKPFKHEPQWAKAKQACQLNMEDIRMAKELGMSPKALLKNQPTPSQRWKLPVKLWIRELHAKRFGFPRRIVEPSDPAAPPLRPSEPEDVDGVIPF